MHARVCVPMQLDMHEVGGGEGEGTQLRRLAHEPCGAARRSQGTSTRQPQPPQVWKRAGVLPVSTPGAACGRATCPRHAPGTHLSAAATPGWGALGAVAHVWTPDRRVDAQAPSPPRAVSPLASPSRRNTPNPQLRCHLGRTSVRPSSFATTRARMTDRRWLQRLFHVLGSRYLGPCGSTMRPLPMNPPSATAAPAPPLSWVRQRSDAEFRKPENASTISRSAAAAASRMVRTDRRSTTPPGADHHSARPPARACGRGIYRCPAMNDVLCMSASCMARRALLAGKGLGLRLFSSMLACSPCGPVGDACALEQVPPIALGAAPAGRGTAAWLQAWGPTFRGPRHSLAAGLLVHVAVVRGAQPSSSCTWDHASMDCGHAVCGIKLHGKRSTAVVHAVVTLSNAAGHPQLTTACTKLVLLQQHRGVSGIPPWGHTHQPASCRRVAGALGEAGTPRVAEVFPTARQTHKSARST